MRRVLAVSMLVAALAAGVAVAAGAQGGPAPADSVKRMAIRHLLAVQRTDSLMLAGIESAFAKQTPSPDLPAGFLDSLRTRIRRDIGEFVENLVPVYDSLYTAAEIDDLVTFYQTALGQRLLHTQPQVTEAAMLIGQRWGMQEAGKVLVDLAGQRPPHP